MKTVRYKISKNEAISCIPDTAFILNARIVFSDGYEALLYFPKKLKYEDDGEVSYDNSGVGSLSFAVFDDLNKWWKKSPDDYFNITLKKYEK